MQRVKVVVIEDEPKIMEIILLYLRQEGHEIHWSLNATEGLELIRTVVPDVLLVDIHLPGSSGFELAREYREISDGILIFLTGEKTKSKIIQGFNLGCDDYITKPFDPAELIARIRANLRRNSKNVALSPMVFGDLMINFTDMSITKAGKEVDLFIKEKMLLFFLAQSPNRVFSVEQLYEEVWGVDSDADTKTVLVHISTLRKKIEENPSQPRYIQTVRGFGYKFVYE